MFVLFVRHFSHFRLLTIAKGVAKRCYSGSFASSKASTEAAGMWRPPSATGSMLCYRRDGLTAMRVGVVVDKAKDYGVHV
jgi:hypothetical protein